MFNLSRENYEDSKSILISIMNNYYSLNKEKRLIKHVVTVGPSGCGKSSISNILYGVNSNECKTGCGSQSCTIEISKPLNTKYPYLKIIDGVGFIPTVSNFAKLFVLLVSKGYFPDYFVLPDEGASDLGELKQLLNEGFIEILIIPFSACSYYTSLNFLKQFNLPNCEQKALFYGFHNRSRKNLKINYKILKYNNSIPTIDCTMKNVFFTHFYKNGEFIDICYDEYNRLKSSINSNKRSIAMFYGYLIHAIQCIPKSDINIINKTIDIKDELKFFS